MATKKSTKKYVIYEMENDIVEGPFSSLEEIRICLEEDYGCDEELLSKMVIHELGPAIKFHIAKKLILDK